MATTLSAATTILKKICKVIVLYIPLHLLLIHTKAIRTKFKMAIGAKTAAVDVDSRLNFLACRYNHKHIVYGRRQLAFQRMSYINYANCVFWLHANSVISSARGKLITVRTRAAIDDWAIGQFHRRTYSFKRNVMSVLDSFFHYFDLIWQRWCVKTQRTNKHKHQSIF